MSVGLHVCSFKRDIQESPLTFSCVVLIRRVLPLVGLHDLDGSPENQSKGGTLNTRIYGNLPRGGSTHRNTDLQMSRAFLASPDTADTFLAQN